MYEILLLAKKSNRHQHLCYYEFITWSTKSRVSKTNTMKKENWNPCLMLWNCCSIQEAFFIQFLVSKLKKMIFIIYLYCFKGHGYLRSAFLFIWESLKKNGFELCSILYLNCIWKIFLKYKCCEVGDLIKNHCEKMTNCQ